MTILRRFWRQILQNFRLRHYARTLTCITVLNSSTVHIRRQKYQKLQTKNLEVLRIAINRNNLIGNQLTSHDVPSRRFREWWSEVRLNPVIQDFITSIRNKARVSYTIYWCVYITRLHTNLTLQITTDHDTKHYRAVVTFLMNWPIFICIIFKRLSSHKKVLQRWLCCYDGGVATKMERSLAACNSYPVVTN